MKNNICTVPSLSALNNLKNVKEDECVYCEKTNKFYVWKENEWIETKNPSNLGISLYEMNKILISSQKPLTGKEISQKSNLIKEFYSKTRNKHYMFLCRDYNYYSIFERNNLTDETLQKILTDIAREIGKIMSIESVDDALEFWIIPKGKLEAYAFYFFPYDKGVIYYG